MEQGHKRNPIGKTAIISGVTLVFWVGAAAFAFLARSALRLQSYPEKYHDFIGPRIMFWVWILLAIAFFVVGPLVAFQRAQRNIPAIRTSPLLLANMVVQWVVGATIGYLIVVEQHMGGAWIVFGLGAAVLLPLWAAYLFHRTTPDYVGVESPGEEVSNPSRDRSLQ